MSIEEKLLLKMASLFYFVQALAGIFLTVFLFKLGGFKAVITYGLVSLIFLFISYILSGYLLKKFSNVDLIRFGFLFLAVLYFLLFMFREQSINFLFILGMLNGIGNGNFWAGNNLTQYIATKEYSRTNYFGRLNFLTNLGSASGPILGGGIIYLFETLKFKDTGYIALFLIVSLLLFYLFFFAGKLPKHEDIKFSVASIFKHKANASWVIVLTQQFLYGLFDTAFAAFSAVLIFLIVRQQEFILGTVNTISAVAYAIASLGAIYILNRHKNGYLPGMVLSAFGLWLFGLQQNWLGILGLIFINNTFLPLLNITTSKTIYDVIDKDKNSWQKKYHYLVERDSILGLGRIINYIILLVFLNTANEIQIAKTWILIVPILPILIGILQWCQFKLINDAPDVNQKAH